METGEDFKSIILKPGFGFCLGKRERYTRVYLSSLDCADDLFSDAELISQRPHAMFFGCDRGDHESWRCFLNSKSPAQEYKKLVLPDKTEKREMKIDERFRRLGIELRNNRRAHIRIAPMKGSDMPKSFLSQNINAVEKWIKNTVSQAKLNPKPANFSVVKETEKPQVGDPFEVLWVKFDFDETMWNDEVMWDIRYLLMGSKMDRFPGFPLELSQVREKIYISRDGDSERKRRMGRD